MEKERPLTSILKVFPPNKDALKIKTKTMRLIQAGEDPLKISACFFKELSYYFSIQLTEDTIRKHYESIIQMLKHFFNAYSIEATRECYGEKAFAWMIQGGNANELKPNIYDKLLDFCHKLRFLNDYAQGSPNEPLPCEKIEEINAGFKSIVTTAQTYKTSLPN